MSSPAVGASRPAVTRAAPRSHPVLLFVLRRVAAGALTLLAATALIFLAIQVLPGDVADTVLGRNATPERIAAVRDSLNLDASLPSRYLSFVGDMATGHFGNSSAALAQGNKVGVWTVIADPLRNSLVLAGITLLLFVPLCALLGIVAATRVGRKRDHAISLVGVALSAMPEFLVGTLLIVVFFTQLDLLPPVSQIDPGRSPFSDVKGLILPILTLLAVSAAFGTRLLRASLVGVLAEDYVATARLNGYRERRVILRYALRNALAPSMQILGQMAQWLIGGIIVTENVFNYPGIGNTLVQAVLVRDTQETMVIATVLAAAYVAINIVADLAVVLIVPKLRTQL